MMQKLTVIGSFDSVCGLYFFLNTSNVWIQVMIVYSHKYSC